MADPNEVGGVVGQWVMDPKNPNRATYTDEFGEVYEAFKDEPVAPVEGVSPQEVAAPEQVRPSVVMGTAPKDTAPRVLPTPKVATTIKFGDEITALDNNVWKEKAAEAASVFDQLMADPARSEQEIRDYVAQSGYTVQNLDENLALRAKGERTKNAVVDARFNDPLGQLDQPIDKIAPGDRGAWDRFSDYFTSESQRGFQGILRRAWDDWADTGKDQLRQQFPGMDDAWYETMSELVSRVGQKAIIQEVEARNAMDPSWSPDESFIQNAISINRWGPALVGVAAGSTGPETFFAPGRTAVSRILNQGLISGLSRAGYNSVDYLQGVSEDLDVEAALIDATVGAVTQGAFEVPGLIKNLMKSRGRDLTPGADPRQPSPTFGEDTAKIVEQKAVKQVIESIDPKLNPRLSDRYVNRVVDEVNKIIAGWKNAPEIRVARDEQEILDTLGVETDPDAIGAVLPDGTVVINLKNVDSPETLRAVVFHEGLGHHGLVQQFGDKLDEILEKMYAQSSFFQKQVDQWIKDNPEAYAEDVNPLARAAEEVLAEMSEAGRVPPPLWKKVERVVREFARKFMNVDLNEREISVILDMAHSATVNGKPRDVAGNGFKYARVYHGSGADFDRFDSNYMGTGEGAQAFGWGHYFSESEKVAKGYRDQMARKSQPKIDPETGQPTIEGKKLEDWLRDNVPTETVRNLPEKTPDGKPIGRKYAAREGVELFSKQPLLTDDELWGIRYHLTNARDIDEAIEEIIDNPRTFTPSFREKVLATGGSLTKYTELREKFLAFMDTMKEKIDKERGKFYEVEIPDDGVWLDWYKPLKDQPDAIKNVFKNEKILTEERFKTLRQELKTIQESIDEVQKKLDPVLFGYPMPEDWGTETSLRKQISTLAAQRKKLEEELFSSLKPNPAGGELYAFLELRLGSPKAASEFLSSKGVTGTRYPIGSLSRNPDGSRTSKQNYVLYKDEDPKIVNKYMRKRPVDKIRLKRKWANSSDGNVLGPESEAAGTFLNELKLYTPGELRKMSVDERIAAAENAGIDMEWLDYYNDRLLGIKTPQPTMSKYLPEVNIGGNKYMRKRQAGTGSKGQLQGGSRQQARNEETDTNLGLGRFRSRENIEGILQEVAEDLPDYSPQSWDEWIEQANDVRNKVKVAKGLKEGSSAPEVLAAREAIVKSANRIAQLSRKAADGTLTERDEYFLMAEMARNAAMQEALAGVRANAARIVNSFKITVESDEAFADSIRNMMSRVNNDVISNPENRRLLIEELAQRADNPEAINRISRDAFKAKAEDYMFRAWYNMLLSAPGTHEVNFLGTGANFIYDLLENTGAAILGQGKRFTNADRVRAREVAYRVWGALRAISTANTWRNAGRSFDTGLTGNMPNSKMENSNVYTGNDKKIKAISYVLESPTRALASEDEWWRGVIQLSNLYGLAVRNAGNKGLKGKAFWNEVNRLIDNPTKEMVDQTNNYTQTLQFLDKPSKIAQGLINLQTPKKNDSILTRVGRGLLKVAVPFVRTPDALIRTAIRRSGFLSPLERVQIAEWQAGGAARDKAKARMIMGSALAFYVSSQVYAGNITGNGPERFDEQQNWLGTHQPNSIKIGDQWYSIQGLEPVSTNITAIASLVERYRAGEINEDDYAKSAISAAHALASTLIDNSYAENLLNLVDVFSADPQKAENAITNFFVGIGASATVPAILRSYTQSEDPAIRDTTGDGTFGSRLEGRISSGVPGLSEQLPQKYDVYGRPMSKESYDPAGRLRQKDVETDPTVIELERLREVYGKALVGPPKKTGISVNGEEPRRLTAEEFQAYQQLSGYWIVESVREEMATPEWETLTDEERIELVNDIKRDMRANAREYLFGNPDEEEDVEGE